MVAIDAVAFGKALADDTRQRIMTMLCCDWMSVGDIVNELSNMGAGITQPTVSHHLGILKNASLVEWRREGKQVFYSLRQDQMAQCCVIVLNNFAPESEVTVSLAESPSAKA